VEYDQDARIEVYQCALNNIPPEISGNVQQLKKKDEREERQRRIKLRVAGEEEGPEM